MKVKHVRGNERTRLCQDVSAAGLGLLALLGISPKARDVLVAQGIMYFLRALHCVTSSPKEGVCIA